MTISVKPLHPLFAAELTGVDLAAGIDPATRDAIERAMDQHGVCVLPDQRLDDETQERGAELRPGRWGSRQSKPAGCASDSSSSDTGGWPGRDFQTF